MKITKHAFIFTATLILVVFSGCSTPGQSRAIDANAPQIAQSSIENNDNLNCNTPITQLEMNLCSAKEANEANEKLNAAYQKLQEKVKGTPQETRLVEAQNAWLAFRDADCEYSKRRYDGGSIMPMIYALCVVDLTEKRTQNLEDYLGQG
ncbi:MAG: lysozyme inhibitor LprI family protein [Cyanobacteria bacterium P01_E01_bin.42]